MPSLTLMKQVLDVGQPEAVSSMLTCNLHALHDERPLVLECPAMQRALKAGVLIRSGLWECAGHQRSARAVPEMHPLNFRPPCNIRRY